MKQQEVAQELAEELRQNTRLRHRLGMVEGTGSGVIHEGDQHHVYIDTADGQTFAFGIMEVDAD